MRKKIYIFTESGKKRYPKKGEYFLSYDKTIVKYAFCDMLVVREILKLEVIEEIERKAVRE